VAPHLAEAWRAEATARLPHADPAHRLAMEELDYLATAMKLPGACPWGAPGLKIPRTTSTAIAGPIHEALRDARYTILAPDKMCTRVPTGATADLNSIRRRPLRTAIPAALYAKVQRPVWSEKMDCVGDWMTKDGSRLISWYAWRAANSTRLPHRPPAWWRETARCLVQHPDDPTKDTLLQELWAPPLPPAPGDMAVCPARKRHGLKYVYTYVYKILETRPNEDGITTDCYVEWWDFDQRGIGIPYTPQRWPEGYT
jgi:hypothetical protein